jgi:hypothetical protein
MHNTTIEEQFQHCIVCLERLSREIGNPRHALEISTLSQTLIMISKQYNNLAPVDTRKLGLYDDHRLDYGVQPNKDIPWTLQTK